VAEATGGLQHPTVDRDNIFQKFRTRDKTPKPDNTIRH